MGGSSSTCALALMDQAPKKAALIARKHTRLRVIIVVEAARMRRSYLVRWFGLKNSAGSSLSAQVKASTSRLSGSRSNMALVKGQADMTWVPVSRAQATMLLKRRLPPPLP